MANEQGELRPRESPDPEALPPTARWRPIPATMDPDDAFAPGAVVDGTYRVLGQLGAGGMGRVLLARDVRLDRDVALKVLHRELARDHSHRERLRGEARAMARIRHPNVVGVHAFGEVEGSPYFVMDYVPTTPLSRAAGGRAVLPLARALTILDQACRGISALHGAGLVHCDLKPANVLVGPALRVAISDLGLTRSVRDGSSWGAGWGTPGYLAPETLLRSGHAPTKLADVYALGVVAFELLCGHPPYASDRERLVAYLDGHPTPSVRESANALPSALDTVLASAMAWEPVRRMGSVDRFRRALLDAAREGLAPCPDVSVLVVDDDPAYRRHAARVVRCALRCAPVIEAGSVREAIAAIRERAPSAIVADLDLPEASGLETAAMLRRDPRARDIPLVMTSASADAADWPLLSRLAADVLLPKPFEPMQLELALRAALESRAEQALASVG